MHNQIISQNGQKNVMHKFIQILSANLKYTIIHDTENSSLITYVLATQYIQSKVIFTVTHDFTLNQRSIQILWRKVYDQIPQRSYVLLRDIQCFLSRNNKGSDVHVYGVDKEILKTNRKNINVAHGLYLILGKTI